MALVLKDRVKETTTTTGTGTITLAGASSGFKSFSAIGNANTTYYTITGGTEWEVGLGTYTSSGNTLSRDTVLESSNGGSLVNFSAGTKDIFITYPADKSIYDNNSGSIIASGILPTSNGGTGLSTYATGDLIYASATNTLSKLTVGTNGYVRLSGYTGNGGILIQDGDDPSNRKTSYKARIKVAAIQNYNFVRELLCYLLIRRLD
jgi:hypothetical protein